MEVDPIGFIEAECFITPSQLTTLSTTSFARHLDFYAAVDDHPWPESSDDDHDVTLPEDDVVTIRICSAPSSPDLDTADHVHRALDGGGVAVSAVELGFCEGRKRAREVSTSLTTAAEEEARLCDCGDDVDVAAVRDAEESEIDGGLGNSDELGFCGRRKRVREENSTDNVVDDTDRARNNVELGKLDDIVVEETQNEVELGNSDDNVDDIVVEETQNDVELGNSDDNVDGIVVEDTEENENDVELGNLDDNVYDIVVEDAEESQNDEELGNLEDDVDDVVVEDTEESQEDDELRSFPRTMKMKAEFNVEDGNGGKNVDQCGVVFEGSGSKNGGKSSGGEVMKCLIQVFRILGERQPKLKDDHDDDDVDLLDTVKRCGYVFPKPRYLG